MRYYSDGNLAKTYYQQSIPQELPDVFAPYPDDDVEKNKENKRRRQNRLEQENEVRYRYKSVTRARTKISLRLLAVILALATVVGYIVWRSAKVTEMSFYNAGLKRQISELDKQNSLLQDKIFSKSSLNTVKDAASTELGLQKPGSDQIIYVPASILKPVISGEEIDAAAEEIRAARLPAENMKLIELWVRSR